ncbi:MAG TPA: FecR domain-containing protein [Myxococcota bacterium]|jgi:hypothetical protein|nr:FecR domain-containing protein [Myxococcota bacterium]
MKGRAVLWLAALGVAAAVVSVPLYLRLFEQPGAGGVPAVAAPAAAPGAGTSPASAFGLVVTSVTGEVTRALSGGGAAPVARGEVLKVDDELRTGRGGAVVLELTEGTAVWMWPDSVLAVRTLADSLSRLRLLAGKVDVAVPLRAGRTFGLEGADTGLASTNGAQFSAIVDGRKVFTVATVSGEVVLAAGDRAVRIPAGMASLAAPGGAPAAAAPIPRTIGLRVDWPSARTRDPEAAVEGDAPVGVLVSVGGVRVAVDAAGRFRARVPLSEGINRIDVEAEDATGNKRSETSPPIVRDSSPPALKVAPTWK